MARAQKHRFWRLNCARSPRICSRASCSDTRKGRSPEPIAVGSASSSNAPEGRFFSTKWGTCPWQLQAKVLRLMQDQSFERVGGSETVRTDVRLIAATHRDLKAYCEESKFRPDLYYRLGVFTIHLPALRERGDDLPMLVKLYVLPVQSRARARCAGGRPPKRWSGCASIPGQETFENCRASSSRPYCALVGRSCFRRFCRRT